MTLETTRFVYECTRGTRPFVVQDVVPHTDFSHSGRLHIKEVNMLRD